MPLKKDDLQQYIILGLIGLFAVLSYLLISPFLFYILGGIVLVYIAFPMYDRIEEALGNASIAALLSLTILIIVAVVPAIFLTERVVAQGQQALVDVGTSTTDFIDTASIEQLILETTGRDVNVEQAIRDAFMEAGRLISAGVPGVISTLFDALIGIFVMGITMYYLFKEGPAILDRSMELVPIEEGRKKRLLADLDQMMDAVLVGHLATAFVQGVVAGIGLWAVGIPNVIFWTFIMILLGVVPLVGNFLVWGPAGLYLIFMQGEVAPGVALLVYGVVVVGLTDNIVRAKVVGKRGRIHPLLVMIGVIGGLPMFGLLGVILGPLVLGFFATLLNVYQQDFLKK